MLRPLHAKVIIKSYLFFQSEDGKKLLPMVGKVLGFKALSMYVEI